MKSVVRAKQAHIPVFTENMMQQNEKTLVNRIEQAVNVQPPPLLAMSGVENEKHVQPPPLVRVKQGGNQDMAQRGPQISTMPVLQTPARAQVSSVSMPVPVNSQIVRPSSSDSSSGSDSGSSDDSSGDGSSDDGLVVATNEGMPQYEHERLQSVFQMEQHTPSVPSHELIRRQSGSTSPFLGPMTTPTHPSPSPQFQRHFPRHFSTDSYNELSPGYAHHHHRLSSHHEFGDRPFTSPHDVSGTVRSLYPTPLPFDDIQAPTVDPPTFEFDLPDTSPYKQSSAGGSPLFPHHVNYTHQHQTCTNARGMIRDMNTTPTGHDSLVSSLFHGSGLLDPPSPTH